METVAQGMAIDAYQYKGSSSGATAADSVVIMANSDIYRTIQVHNALCNLKTMFYNVISFSRVVNEERLNTKLILMFIKCAAFQS